jgi:hypothetical protein
MTNLLDTFKGTVDYTGKVKKFKQEILPKGKQSQHYKKHINYEMKLGWSGMDEYREQVKRSKKRSL